MSLDVKRLEFLKILKNYVSLSGFFPLIKNELLKSDIELSCYVLPFIFINKIEKRLDDLEHKLNSLINKK